MGYSNAYLFGRFADAAEAVGKARELLARSTSPPEFEAVAVLGSHSGLDRFLTLPGPPPQADFTLPEDLADRAEQLFPGATLYLDRKPWVLGHLDEALVTALAALPPVDVNVDVGERPYGELEDLIVGAVGDAWADLSWSCAWTGGGSYCGVGITLNGSGLFEEVRRDGHELYWHVGGKVPGGDELAARYAAEVGLVAEFPPLRGW